MGVNSKIYLMQMSQLSASLELAKASIGAPRVDATGEDAGNVTVTVPVYVAPQFDTITRADANGSRSLDAASVYFQVE